MGTLTFFLSKMSFVKVEPNADARAILKANKGRKLNWSVYAIKYGSKEEQEVLACIDAMGRYKKKAPKSEDDGKESEKTEKEKKEKEEELFYAKNITDLYISPKKKDEDGKEGEDSSQKTLKEFKRKKVHKYTDEFNQSVLAPFLASIHSNFIEQKRSGLGVINVEYKTGKDTNGNDTYDDKLVVIMFCPPGGKTKDKWFSLQFSKTSRRVLKVRSLLRPKLLLLLTQLI